MKLPLKSILIFFFISSFCAWLWADNNIKGNNIETIFKNPKDKVETSCYWYWISGNITKEGVINDLKAMNRAGINRAYIGNIGLPPEEFPTGKVKMLSAEWMEIMHVALKTATQLGIEIGVFNSPGWSQAGGPWNTPEQSMKYLAFQELEIESNGSIDIKFDSIKNDINQTVKVLAYKIPSSFVSINQDNAELPNDAIKMFDNDPTTKYTISTPNVDIVVKPMIKDFTSRSLQIIIDDKPIIGKCILSLKDSNGWRSIREFSINRTNISPEVGYDSFAPISISFPETKGTEYKISFIGMNPGCSIKEIELSSAPIVEQYSEKILSKMHQTPLPYWNEYKWTNNYTKSDSICITTSDIIDITSGYINNNLKYNLPVGMWRIVRAYMMPTGICNGPSLTDGRGLEVDRWNKKHLEHHYNSFIGKILERVPVQDRKTWKVIVCDSYEKATQNFGEEFIEDFKIRYNYDPTPYLLTYIGTVVGGNEQSDRFLWDVRRMIADKLAYDHIGGMRKLANKDGFRVWLENYGHWGFPGEFLQYGGQADDVAGEFWSEGELGNIENRAASSCGHIYGKNKIYAESFTCGGNAFARYPNLMKQRGDKFFTEGINSTLLHLVISQPDETTLPGLNAPFGNEFNRKNTWYNQLYQFTDYLKRCNYMLQQGTYVADVAYFIGEDTPVMTGITMPSLPKGYQYDYINAEVIKSSLLADTNHVLSLPHGTKYRLLVLPPTNTMRPDMLMRIKQLVMNGAIVLGPKPLKSPSLQDYPQCDIDVKTISDELWGQSTENKVMRKIGKGYIFSNYNIEDIFEILGIKPDFKHFASQEILYSHTNQVDRDIYFVSNQSNDTLQFNAQFRINGKIPEFWNPVTAEVGDAKTYTTLNDITNVPIKLYPLESTFVVFQKDINNDKPLKQVSNNNETCIKNLNDEWSVTFTDMFGKSKALNYGSLSDWSKHTDLSIKYFSGEAKYERSFDYKSNNDSSRVYLDLGKVGVIASIKINGKYLGGVWTAPYKIDITDALRNGKNKLEINVANTWVNRLIGDLNIPKNSRKTSCPNNPYLATSPLQESGLIGPVRMITENK